MIDIECTCGAHFQVLNEQVAARTRCQRCGALAADVLGLSREEPGESAVEQSEPAEPSFRVPCGNHPDQLAAHNCMYCGKPLCIGCVQERGYYCSEKCKQAVAATEPDAAAANSRELAAMSERVGRSMEFLGVWLKRLSIVAGLALVGWIGWLVWQRVAAPKAQVTASWGVSSGVDSFKARMIGPDLVVLQANDDLSLVTLSRQQKLWIVNLRALEEKEQPSSRRGSAEDVSMIPMGELRDPLGFADVQGDDLIVHSRRQIIDFDVKTGTPKWKFFDPTISIGSALVHEGGVWCSISPSWSSRLPGKTWFADFSLASGRPAWSYTNQTGYVAGSVCGSGRVALLVHTPRPKTAGSQPDEDLPTNAQGEVTAGPAEKFSLQKILGQARGEAELGPSSDYTVRFFSLADGQSLGQTNLSLVGTPRLEHIGGHLCLMSGRDLTMFDNDAGPLWQVKLSSEIQAIDGTNNLILARTSGGLTALDAVSGGQKWTRQDLTVEGPMAVAPDGSVYVTVAISKEREKDGEAKGFRNATIASVGSRIPGEPITTLIKLDPQTGKTRWGVKNIGRRVSFSGQDVYVLDEIPQVNLLANQLMVDTFSVRVLAPRNGKDTWVFMKPADVCHFQMMSNQVFLVTADDPASGREHPVRIYELQVVEAK